MGSLALAALGAQTSEPRGEEAIADLFVNGEPRGSVQFLLGEGSSPLLEASLVRSALAGLAKPELIAAVAARDRLVSTDELRLVGALVAFDPAELTLRIDLEPRAMIPVDLSAKAARRAISGGAAIESEPFSAQLGLSAILDPLYSSDADGSRLSPRGELGLEPAMNLMGFVAEGSARLAYDGGFSATIAEARLLRDFPAIGARLAAGIVSTRAASFQSSFELLGLAFYRENSLPGARAAAKPILDEILLRDRAELSIEVNGIAAKRLRLEPGSYRVSDLPLASGLNEVLVRIEEEGREPREIKLGLPFDSAILEAGKLDYSLALGAVRDRPELFLGAGSVALGLGSSLQLGADAEAGLGRALGGFSARWASPIGALGAAASASSAYEGASAFSPSFGARLSWRLTIPRLRYAPRIGLAAEYRGPGFGPPFAESSTALPLAHSWALSGQVSETLPGNAGSAYAFADSSLEGGELKRLSLSAGLFLPLSKSSSISVSGGADWKEGKGFSPSASVSLSVATADRRSLYYRHEAIEGSDSVSISAALDPAGRSSVAARGEGRLGTEGRGRDIGLSGKSSAGAFELSAAADFWEGPDSKSRSIGGSLSASTGLAYAGGHLVAARELGEAFAIMVPKPSLGGAKVELRPIGAQASASEGGAPALVSGIVPYETYIASAEMPDSPPGLSAEPAAIELHPSYRSGAIVELTAAASLTARGRLVDASGRPRAGISGDRIGWDGAILALTGTFTDEEGRFECYGLGPGFQAIRWSDGSLSRFSVDEVPSADGGDSPPIAELGDVASAGMEEAGPGGGADD
jgi:outer membrane usher protein